MEYEYRHQPLPSGMRSARFLLWLPQKERPLRAVLCSSDYEAGRTLYYHPEWRTFAEKHDCACLLYDLTVNRERHRLAKDKTAADLLPVALKDFARQFGQANLANTGMVLTGLSQSGWQAVAFANLLSSRIIAAVPIHEATPAPERGPEEGNKPAGWAVPQLHVMGGRCFLTPLIQPWVLKAREHGALWTTYLQPGEQHHRVGDQRFILAWLEAVLSLRVSEGGNGRLNSLRATDGWLGHYTLTTRYTTTGTDTPPKIAPGQRPPDAETIVVKTEIAPATADKLPAGESIWLPDARVAELWRAG
ncbi:MAG: hypothetical protein OHK0029_11670 [Armatimonadaceae bacterium]